MFRVLFHPKFKCNLDVLYVPPTQVGERCGFVMEEDKLRIPSTKRICFVGRRRNHNEEERPRILSDIHGLLPKESNKENDGVEPSEKKSRPDESAAPGFVPRESAIPVRNCTRIEQSLKDEIVRTIADKCLESAVPLRGAEEKLLKAATDPDWNMGRGVPLSEAAEAVGAERLARLKSECGGLQTLLRNHGHIFVVIAGVVRLRCHATDALGAGRRRKKGRKFASEEEVRKRKLCWFHDHHPQGCPVASKDCTWAHGEKELVT